MLHGELADRQPKFRFFWHITHEMTQLRFEPSGFEVKDVTKGTRIVDITDAHAAAGVPYDCRSASCGTCRVEVLEGAEALSDAEDEELNLLDIFGGQPRVRLACQMRVTKEHARVVLRVVGDIP